MFRNASLVGDYSFYTLTSKTKLGSHRYTAVFESKPPSNNLLFIITIPSWLAHRHLSIGTVHPRQVVVAVGTLPFIDNLEEMSVDTTNQ